MDSEIATAFGSDLQDWESELAFCRALMKCGVDEFRKFAESKGALFKATERIRNKENSFREAVAAAIAERWVTLDREGALTSLALGDESKADLVVWVLRFVARQLSEEILTAAVSPDPPSWVGDWLGHAIEGLASRDAAAARAWMKRLPEKLVTSGVRFQFGRGLAVSEPEAYFGSGQKGLVNTSLALKAARARGPGILRRIIPLLRDHDQSTALMWLMRDAPADAVSIYAQMINEDPAGAEKRTWFFDLRVSSAVFAVGDPSGARQWVNTLSGPARSHAVKGFVRGWAAHDPAAAIAWSAQQPAEADPSALQAEAFRTWLAIDRTAAYAWVAGQPESLRQAIEASAIDLYTQAGRYAEAAELCLRFAAKTEPITVRILAADYARGQPQAAARWAAALPPGAVQDTAIDAVTMIWSATDPGSAQAWATGLPAGPARDGALASLIKFAPLSTQNPERIVEAIADPWQKTKAAARWFEQWRRFDAPAARRWFGALPGLDPEYQRDVMEEHADD